MPTTKQLDDPRTMRAIAHPLRLRLLGLLRVEGPATATVLAEATGDSVPLVSYHLRQLAEHGFIEEARELARNGKERPWRASHEQTSWRTVEFLDSPERLAAEDAFAREVVRVYLEEIERWRRERTSWGPEWIDASDMSDWVMRLSPDQLRGLREDLHAVLDRWRGSEPGDGAEHVQVILHAFPRKVGKP